MPKIIEANREMIIEVTKSLIKEKRYDDINCRNIASLCDIGVGTLYHFFNSKMDILAAIMLNDWKECLLEINTSTSLEEGIESIYNAILNFSMRYIDLWKESKEGTEAYLSNQYRHQRMVDLLSGYVNSLIAYNSVTVDEDIIFFVSDSILSHASKLTPYEKVKRIYLRLLKGE